MAALFTKFQGLYPFGFRHLLMWWLLPVTAAALLWQLLALLRVLGIPYVAVLAFIPVLAYARLYGHRVGSLTFWPSTIGFLVCTAIVIALGRDLLRVAQAGVGIIETRTGNAIGLPLLWLMVFYAAALGVVTFVSVDRTED